MDDKCDTEYNGPLHQTGGGIHRLIKCRFVQPTTEPTAQEVQLRLEKAYENGQPFFTKESIQNAWEQIKREVKQGDKVFTKEIGGGLVQCVVMTGEFDSMGDRDGDGVEWRYICKELVLEYNCRASLLKRIKWREEFGLEPRFSELCPVTFAHEGYRVNNKTNEVLLPALTFEFEFVTKTFQDKVREWNESQACNKLKSFLTSLANEHKINKAIGFALGDLSRDYGPKDGFRSLHRASSQHGLLLTLREWLQERDSSHDIPCYAQEPAYNSMDKRILSEAGIEVIDDPRGWLEVDEQSLMISVAPNVPIKEIIADIARPAAIVWCRVGFDDGLDHGLTDPDSPRVRTMMEGYEVCEFGPDEELFSNIALYIRKSKAAVAPNTGHCVTCP